MENNWDLEISLRIETVAFLQRKNTNTMKITGLYCPKCKQFIYSRDRHDCKWCKCQTYYIDGGQLEEVFGTGGKDKNFPSLILTIDLDVTSDELYYDWNLCMDKLGFIDDFVVPKEKPKTWFAKLKNILNVKR